MEIVNDKRAYRRTSLGRITAGGPLANARSEIVGPARYSALSPLNRGTTQTCPDQFRYQPRVLFGGGTVGGIVKTPWNIRRKFVKKSVGSSNVPTNFVKSRNLMLR